MVPVVNVFYQALSHGVGTYWQNLVDDPDTRHAILLTLIVAPVSVVLNVVFRHGRRLGRHALSISAAARFW